MRLWRGLLILILIPCPEFKNQNCINGVPMELSSDETSLLLRKGVATIRPRYMVMIRCIVV